MIHAARLLTHQDADEAANIFDLSRREVCCLAERETGDLNTHMDHGGRKKTKQTSEPPAQIRADLQKTPDITINALIDQLHG